MTGAVANEAPQLWGAVVSHVPFVDVLNTILDETPAADADSSGPSGAIRSTDKAAFELIRSYSPYDQLRNQAYPPMLVTAGLERSAGHVLGGREVRRETAIAQDRSAIVLLLKTNMGAGHQGKSGRYDSLREVAEEYAFVLTVMGKA